MISAAAMSKYAALVLQIDLVCLCTITQSDTEWRRKRSPNGASGRLTKTGKVNNEAMLLILDCSSNDGFAEPIKVTLNGVVILKCFSERTKTWGEMRS